MKCYQKINSVFKRDPKTHQFTTEYATPEIGYLADLMWHWYEKVDGTNIRVGYNGTDVVLGGRTERAQIPAALVQRLQELFPVEAMRGAFDGGDYDGDTWAVLYGEGYGHKIQKPGTLYKPGGVDFVLFDVRVGRWWLRRDDVCKVATWLGCQVVARVGCGSIANAIPFVRSGFDSVLAETPHTPAEGLVLHPVVPMFTRNGSRVVCKLKQKDFK
jgi:hypothetical protein